MAHEFKIKNGLQILNTHVIQGITNDPSIFTLAFDTSSGVLVPTAQAIKTFTNTTFIKESSLGSVFQWDGGLLDVSIASGSSVTLKENGIALNIQPNYNYLTNGYLPILSNDDLQSETEIKLQFLSLFDVDPTGLSNGDMFRFNEATGKLEPIKITPFVDILNSSEAEIYVNKLLSIFVPAGYKINSIVIKEYAGANAGNISLGLSSESSEIISSYPIVANADISIPIGLDYFSSVNPTELYISSSNFGSSKLTIYLNLIKII